MFYSAVFSVYINIIKGHYDEIKHDNRKMCNELKTCTVEQKYLEHNRPQHTACVERFFICMCVYAHALEIVCGRHSI